MSAGPPDPPRVTWLPAGIGPIALVVVSLIAIGAAAWGACFSDPAIVVRRFDAGPVERFAIGEVMAYPEIDLYVVGLQDGRIRALDGRVEASGCAVEWRPDDARGAAVNPGDAPGAFVDPCSGAVWAREGHAVSGTREPLRTPQVSYRPGDDGALHVVVEMINHPAFP